MTITTIKSHHIMKQYTKSLAITTFNVLFFYLSIFSVGISNLFLAYTIFGTIVLILLLLAIAGTIYSNNEENARKILKVFKDSKPFNNYNYILFQRTISVLILCGAIYLGWFGIATFLSINLVLAVYISWTMRAALDEVEKQGLSLE